MSNKQNDQSFHKKYRPNKQPDFPENTVQSEVKQGIVKQGVKPVKYCTYCKRQGHIDTECYSKARRDNRYRSTPVQCAVYPGDLDTPIHAPHNPPLEAETDNMVNIPHSVDNKVVKYIYDDVQRYFKPFLSDGYVSSVDGDNRTPIRILRDTGASRSLLLQGAVQLPDSSNTGERSIIQGVDMKYIPLSLHNINLECGGVNGKVTVGVLHSIPCEGISLLLGNDLAGGKVHPAPVVCDTPLTEIEHPKMCNVITRAASKRIEQSENVDVLDGLQDTFLNNTDTDIVHIQNQSCSKKQLITDQQYDETLTTSFYDDLVSICDIDDHDVCYYTKSGILMRKFRPSDAKLDESWRIRHQIVLPQSYRDNVLSIAHDIPLAGHLGLKKRLTEYYNISSGRVFVVAWQNPVKHVTRAK